MAELEPDIRILVGSEITQSTNQIRKELESAFSKNSLQINAKISDSALQIIQKQLDSLKVNISVSGTNSSTSNNKSSSVAVEDYSGARVSAKAMSQATKELTDAKIKAISALSQEKVANEKSIGAAKTATAQANAETAAIRKKETARKASVAVAKDLQVAENQLSKIQEQAYKKSSSFSNTANKLDLTDYKQYESQIKSVLSLYEKVQTSTGRDANQYLNQANVEAEKLKSTFEKIISSEKQLNSTARINTNATSGLSSFNEYLRTVKPSALREFSSEIENIKENFTKAMNDSGTSAKKAFDQANNGVKTLKANFKDMGAEGGNIFTYLQGKLKTFAVYLASSAITMGAIGVFKNAVDSVYDLDKALTNLRIVQNSTKENAQELLVTYNQLAQKLGSTTTEVANSAIEWQRQGYSEADANTLLTDSMDLSIVGMMDSTDAAKALTAAMKSYGISANDAISIVDKWTSLDMVSATSAGDIATAAQQVMTTANLVGVSIDQLSAQIAVIAETTQDSAESVGNSLKSIYARMSKIKQGRLIDPDTMEDLSNVETALKGENIQLRENGDTFRNFGEVLQEVASKWDGLSSVSKANISNAIAGVHQYEKFNVLMQNYGKVLDYTKTAQDSAGTTAQKMGVYTESLEAKQNKLTSAFQGFANSGVLQWLVGAFLDVGTTITNLGSKLNGLPLTLAAVVAAFITLNSVVKAFKASKLDISFATTFKDLAEPENDGHQWNIVASHSKEAA